MDIVSNSLLQDQVRKCPWSTPLLIKAFNGKSTARVSHKVSIMVEALGRKEKRLFHILETPFPFIHGNPYLTEMNPIIDFASRTVTAREAPSNGVTYLDEEPVLEPGDTLAIAVIQKAADKETAMPEELKDFADVLNNEPLSKLPPKRPEFDMDIELLPGAKITSLPPYKLADVEAEIIDAIIKEGMDKV